MAGNDGTLVIEGARIIFRNFAGREGMYNRDGDRNFCVLLEPELAVQMAEDGWNVKSLKAREETDDVQPYLMVTVGFKIRPPRIVMITSRGRTDLSEHEVEVLDWVDVRNVDLIVRPYEWAVNGKTGIKAYLKSLFITIDEDVLELKYADVPETRAITAKGDDIIDVEFFEEPDMKALPSRSGKVNE